MITCPHCGAELDVGKRPASKAPEAVMKRRSIILGYPKARAVDLAATLQCSVDTVHRVRREYELK